MYSKAKFDLDEQNQPVIRLTISNDTEDLRDVVAKQFTEHLGGSSCWCRIFCESGADGLSYWTITPIKPDELQKESREMIK